MTIRRHISLIILALCALAAPAHAQLIFTPDSWDFGTISETEGRVSHTFTGENRSDKPVVILDVVTTCGCTVPEFTKRPIRPGEKTTIKVTFDPTNRPGAFTKELGVYSSERRKIATLTVRGSVTPRTKTTEELYPVDAGGGLRLASTLCTFSYIREGQQVQSAIGCINTSNRPVRLELHPKESSGLLAADYPRKLAPGQTAEINLMYLNPEGAPRYGSLRDALEVRADGRGNGTLIVAHGIGIDKSPADARRTPKVQITENIIKFGPVKHNAPQQQRTFTLTNTGDGELIVRGADLLDGTPIFDIKPYLPYVDAYPDARGGFTDTTKEYALQVVCPDALLCKVPENKRAALSGVLKNDPRPAYQHDPERVYTLDFGCNKVKFTVDGDILKVVDIL